MVVLVLQIGQLSKHIIPSHSAHTHTCPQLQNKTLGGFVRHVTHWLDLKV